MNRTLTLQYEQYPTRNQPGTRTIGNLAIPSYLNEPVDSMLRIGNAASLYCGRQTDATLSRCLIWPAVLMCCLCITAEMNASENVVAAVKPMVDFNRQIRPLLAKHCYACHGPDKAESGLRFSDFESAIKATDSGLLAIDPKKPESSELLVRVTSNDASLRMPPEGEGLSEHNIALLKQWIAEGAEYSVHWSFQPVKNVDIPSTNHSDWVRNPIDSFILASLEQAKLEPNGPAAPRALAKRLYYSILGVPPTPEETDRFVANPSMDAYESLVDQLLADPRMGERWGRHWLDVVRYAETNSFERDGLKPNAWKYRDYVVQSFNSDKPYDRFVFEQLAGDEIDNPTIESLTATGFYRLGIWDDEPADPLQAKFDGFDDLVTVTGQGLLGLTFNCARCHDHKIDPIPQRDYYQMVAFFRDVEPYGHRGDQTSANQIDVSSPEVRESYRELEKRNTEIDKEQHRIEQMGIAKMSGENQRKTEGSERNKVLREQLRENLNDEEWKEYQSLKNEKSEIVKTLKSFPDREFILGLAKSDPHPPETHILLRGSPQAEGDVVKPGFPAMTKEPAPEITIASKGSQTAARRKVLANWIVNEKNWFTSRVIVNRLWQHHFGRGIVRSSNNFGQLGDQPTHPELLDWLASELIRHNWNLKPIHRAIVMSRSFRMSSDYQTAGMAQDPANNLFWQYPMRRLSAEELRDSILATSGDLNFEKFGPSFYPDVANEVKAGQSKPGSGWKNSSASDRARRSIYIHIKRSLIPPELSVFDFPETDTSCEARFLTTQAAQALGLLNGKFLQDQSMRFAERVKRVAGNNQAEQIATAIRLAYGRVANDEDQSLAVALIDKLKDEHHLDADQQLKEYCLMLLNTNEFMYLD
jgi:cytochrome c553